MEPPGAEPHAGWCGRGGRRNPATSTRLGDFKADDSGKNESHTEQARGCCWIAQENDPAKDRACGPDPGPHGIGRADGKGLRGEPEKSDADEERCHRADGRPQAGKSICKFEADGPGDLEETGDNKKNPRHDVVDGLPGSSLNCIWSGEVVFASENLEGMKKNALVKGWKVRFMADMCESPNDPLGHNSVLHALSNLVEQPISTQ